MARMARASRVVGEIASSLLDLPALADTNPPRADYADTPDCFARAGDQPSFGSAASISGSRSPTPRHWGETAMWPSETKDPLPETFAERQQAVRSPSQLRAMNFKFIVALYVVIMGLLTIVLHTGFNPMLRPLVTLLGIVGGVSLFLRSRVMGNSQSPINLPEAPPGIVPEGAKKVYNLKDLPPETCRQPRPKEDVRVGRRAGGMG